MAGRGKAHSLKGTQTSMGGIPIVGFGEDGSIEAEPTSDRGEVVEGADGEESVFCFNHSRNWTVTIQLSETARSVLLLEVAADTQEALAGAGLPCELTFSFWNPRTGERLTTATAFFMTDPTLGAARKAGTREFKISVLSGKRTPPAGNLV